ncbi:conjugal transfer protein TraF [Marinospirillum alkaliphilum]|uniref:Plasmid transfer operon, TraF, protein n=1 Tax=Marinospirillum alkaliphilum DSM 21637 TaxID=1122209 RepID=A0A1K1U6I6_9GAMM|nr:conjugal transfer protein TraF [Marinospirillum alkaliphilum]SFX08593.1 plasmid transfer operon, TraF, protein [Marinospirillum alkaliphilum DSM 21637]
MKLSRLAVAMAALSLPLVATTAAANQSLVSPGYSATIGGVSNRGTVHSSSFNPASNNLLLKEGERLRFGYFSNIGMYMEFGQVDELEDTLDGLVDLFGDKEINLEDIGLDPQGAVDEVVDAIDKLLNDLERNGQFRFGGMVQAPLTPFIIGSQSAKGTFSINASGSVQGSLGIINGKTNITLKTYNPGDETIELDSGNTDAGVDLRVASITHLAVGYGTNLGEWADFSLPKGELELGARLNLYQVETARTFIALQTDDDEFDIGDSFDAAENNTKNTSQMGLDLGLMWHTSNMQAGVTLYNLNEPTFKYPDLTDVLDSGSLTALQNLESYGKSKVADSVTLTRHAVVEGAYFTQNRNWVIQGYYTLGTATNFVGDESQMMGVSAGYFSDSWFIPGARFGYNKNLTGTELSTINGGITLGGMFNLDVAMGLETVDVDGDSIPRYFAISLGFEEKF